MDAKGQGLFGLSHVSALQFLPRLWIFIHWSCFRKFTGCWVDV